MTEPTGRGDCLRLLARPLHQLAASLDRMGWWLTEGDKRKAKREHERAVLAESRPRDTGEYEQIPSRPTRPHPKPNPGKPRR